MNAVATIRRLPPFALWALIAAACAARFVYLNSDPKLEFWIGYVTDEARWVETARNIALFGEPRLYTLSQLHLVLNPACQAVSLVLFDLFGVSLWSARMWSAACGAALVVVVARSLGQVAPGVPQVLAITIVGFEPLMLGLGRTALPEVPSVFFTVCGFLAIVLGRRRLAAAALGGLLLAVAMAMKLTTVLVAPAFMLMIMLTGVNESLRDRLLRLGAFGLGVGIPGLAGVLVAYAAGLVRLESLADVARPILRSLDLGTPFVFLARLVMPPVPWASVALLLLGAWVGSWVLPFWSRFRGTPLGELYLHSGIWIATWFAMVGSLDYTPWRYTVHCIVPLALHVAAGLALWREIGPAKVIAKACSTHRMWRAVSLAWLCIPAAVLVGMPIVALTTQAGWPIDRLSRRLVVVAVLAIAFVGLARAAWTVDRTYRGFIVFAVAGTLLQVMLDAIAGLVLPLAVEARVMPGARLALLAACAGWIATQPQRALETGQAQRTGALILAVALAGVVLHGAIAVLDPTYSIRDASRDLAHRFDGARPVRSVGAGTTLIETKIHYRDEDLPGADFDGIVSVYHDYKLPPGFVWEHAYFLVPHPRYALPGRYSMESEQVRVDVFRKDRTGSSPSATSASPPAPSSRRTN